MDKAKAYSFTLFNTLANASRLINTHKAHGQNKTIKKLFKATIAYLNARAIISNVNIKINSIFFDKRKETLFIYAIKNGNTLYTIEAIRTIGASFMVKTPDNDTRIEIWLTKWLAVKLDYDKPAWFIMEAYKKIQSHLQ